MLKNKLLMMLLLMVFGLNVVAKEPEVSGPTVIVQIAPQYPRMALLAKVEGWVTILMHINDQGSVDQVDVVDSKPNRIFDEAAIAAGMKFKFAPKLIDGKRVPSKARITIEFELPEDFKLEEEVPANGDNQKPQSQD